MFPTKLCEVSRESNQCFNLTAFSKNYSQNKQELFSFPYINNNPLPKFSGDANKDVREFLRQLDQAALFYKLTDSQKAEVLPLLLTDNANVWFSASSHLTGKTYNQLCEELIKQFHSQSDIWLLRQQLLNKKQTENESVVQFATENTKALSVLRCVK